MSFTPGSSHSFALPSSSCGLFVGLLSRGCNMIVLLQISYSQMTELINSKQVEDYVRSHAICQNKSPGHTYLQRFDGGGGCCLQVPLAGKPLSIIVSVPVIPVEGILKVYWAMGHLCHIMQ